MIALAMAVLLVAEFLHIPYYELSPGPTAPVSELITVPASDRHPVHGSLLLVTVYQTHLTTVGYLRAQVSSNVQVYSAEQILGGLPASQLVAQDQAEMAQSQQYAEVAALRRLGYSVPEHGTGVLVAYILKNTPAAHALQLGDTILSIDGRATLTDSQLVAVLAQEHPGQRVTLAVQNPKGQDRTVSLTLAKRPGSPSEGFLGIGPLTRNDSFDFPLKISINAGGIGGPSAGLAFTLGIIDALTGGNLTGRSVMAATGTIDVNGKVGDVGGVAEKAVAVSRAGATLFLVPPQEYATARAHAGPHLKVVAVSTLDQALKAIGANGGDLRGIPPPPPAFR
ncbi:MAG: YlbL family protein [Acidimicrobiales bacterium]